MHFARRDGSEVDRCWGITRRKNGGAVLRPMRHIASTCLVERHNVRRSCPELPAACKSFEIESGLWLVLVPVSFVCVFTCVPHHECSFSSSFKQSLGPLNHVATFIFLMLIVPLAYGKTLKPQRMVWFVPDRRPTDTCLATRGLR